MRMAPAASAAVSGSEDDKLFLKPESLVMVVSRVHERGVDGALLLGFCMCPLVDSKNVMSVGRYKPLPPFWRLHRSGIVLVPLHTRCQTVPMPTGLVHPARLRAAATLLPTATARTASWTAAAETRLAQPEARPL